MHLATVIVEQVAHLVLCEKDGFFRITDLNRKFLQNWPETMEALIVTERLTELNTWFRQEGQAALDHIQLARQVHGLFVAGICWKRVFSLA